MAACAGSGSNTPVAAGSNPPADTGNPAPDPRSAATAAASTDADSAVLAQLSDITVGQAVSTTLPDGSPAVIARPSAKSVSCFSAVCTHMGCTVQPEGSQLHCPCHGSVFDALTGKVVHGPAERALPEIAVHVAGGDVVTGT